MSSNEIVGLDMGHVAFLQQLANSTYSNISTRDRRKHNPDTRHKREWRLLSETEVERERERKRDCKRERERENESGKKDE